jgi:Ser/Thr protein kinase RdoA (MazF antagonist)
MPRGAFHGDTNPTNFLYTNGHISAVLDFDQSSYGFLLYDIANLIYWWTWPDKGEIDFGRSKVLLNEYELCRPLAEHEKQHLYDMLKLVNLISIGWFMYEDLDFANGKRKVELLNTIGREAFYKMLFGESSNPIGPMRSGTNTRSL